MADVLQVDLLPAAMLMAMPLQPPMPLMRILLRPWLLNVSITLKVQGFEAEVWDRERTERTGCSVRGYWIDGF